MAPKYLQIANELKNNLKQYTIDGTNKLPTEQQLCEHFHASRQTIRQSLLQLEQLGFIVRRQGSGSFLTGLQPDADKNIIVVLLPTDSEYTYARQYATLSAELHKYGFSSELYLTNYSIAIERRILLTLQARQIGGIIIEPVKSALPNPNLDLFQRFFSEQIPVIFLQNNYSNFPVQLCARIDQISGGMLATNYLLSRHHQSIGAIFSSDTVEGHDRYLGYALAMNEAKLPFSDDSILWYDTNDLLALEKKQDTRFLTDYIHQHLSSCSAVICHNDEIAYWLIKELSYSGIQVPVDLSIISFDNSYLCDFSSPGITSLSCKELSPVRLAVHLLLAKLQGIHPPQDVISYEIIERDSVTDCI
ncbi:MAG: GntR family transcriptional regulator [bacterium]|nr:GntR family transcriptional regulator [bacterium]